MKHVFKFNFNSLDMITYESELLSLFFNIKLCCAFQIKQESFLEDVNNLLNAGEVPNLYPLDERQEIQEKMRQLDR